MISETPSINSGQAKTCQNCKKQFIIEPDDFQFYEKIQVPAPTWCPECRLIRRLAWRNERSLYRQTCAKCNKSIISVFPEDSGLVVYCRPCWWSDDWDGLSYSANYDPNKPFLTQLRDLMQRVPVMALYGIEHTLENSPHTNMVSYVKNCYLVTYADGSENCAYCSFIDKCKDSLDNLMLFESELCYENVNCRKCYRTIFSVDCESCDNVSFSRNCVGCSDCIGCVNLRNKKYHIFNKPYSKEEYKKLAEDFAPNRSERIEAIKKKAHDFWENFPQKYMHERHNRDVSGDYIDSSKNTHDTFVGHGIEDCRFCSFISPGNVKDCYDYTHYGSGVEQVYDSLQVGDHAAQIFFSWFAVSSTQNVEYSMFVAGCENIFGSVGLKKKQFCILNKQYSKEEYEKLRGQIVKQMNERPYKDSLGREYRYGEFFPTEMSPFGYNATTAQEFFPITKEQAQKRGYRWKKQEKYEYGITIRAVDIPKSAKDTPESILFEVIECEHKGECVEQCSTAFKINRSELDFYRQMKLPIPKLCPNCRHYTRFRFRNPMKLWRKKCACIGIESRDGTYENSIKHFHNDDPCPNEFETSYAPDRPEIVYCEACYNTEVV